MRRNYTPSVDAYGHVYRSSNDCDPGAQDLVKYEPLTLFLIYTIMSDCRSNFSVYLDTDGASCLKCGVTQARYET